MPKLRIKEYAKRLRGISPMERILPSRDGVLEVKVTGKELYSEINNALPSPDVMDYLFDISTHAERLSRLNIVLDDEVDLEKAKETYSDYITVMARKTLKELRAYTFKILGFLGFGAMVLILSYFLESRFGRVIYDSVNIIGGFSIWEAADLFFFARWEKRRELISVLRLLDASWSQRDIS
ncbi:MAG: hypothetical protein ACI4S4_01530 [Candidatus Ornithospirochaeta sp.]